MRSTARPDDTPHLRWMDRTGLWLMLVTDVAVAAALIRLGWSAPVYAFCIPYAAALTIGWGVVRLRPAPAYGLASAVAAVPLLLQAAFYACFWLFLIHTDLHAGPIGWFPAVVWYGTFVTFFAVGPFFGVVLLLTARRALVLFLAQWLGPLLFLALA